MNDTFKERIGNRDYVTFGADTEIPYGLLSTDSNIFNFFPSPYLVNDASRGRQVSTLSEPISTMT